MRGEELEHLRRLAGGRRERELSPKGPWELIQGKRILLSAPHEATHLRDGLEKTAEQGDG